MLNISKNSINRDKILKNQSAYQDVVSESSSRNLVFLFTGLFLIGFTLLFFPWTQNIRARGNVTTLKPENREQNIHSLITGRVEKWYVSEGQEVKKGDTIVFISEVKSQYLDPRLYERSVNMTDAKKASVQSYNNKAAALADQISAIERNAVLKLDQANNYFEQSRLKVISDSIDYHTAEVNYDIAQKQFERQEKLYLQGLKSLTELESRKQKLQQALYKRISIENKWMTSQNKYINAKLNLSVVKNEFLEKIAKAKSDRQTAISNALQSEGDYQKLSIQQSNYSKRSGFYYITAPQDGFVMRALVTGIGETVREGESVFSFIPKDFDLAVEMYVRPIDLPLIQKDRKVQLQFDGWPALIFSGWPGMSFGTYSGSIVAFDKVADSKGHFRILIAPDRDNAPWPTLLRLGSGVYGIALLKKVPVWYELWRNLNGFPPDFYIEDDGEKNIKYK